MRLWHIPTKPNWFGKFAAFFPASKFQSLMLICFFIFVVHTIIFPFWIPKLLLLPNHELSRGYFGCHGNRDWRHGLCNCFSLLLPLPSAREIIPKRHRFLSSGPFWPFQAKRVTLSSRVAENGWVELCFCICLFNFIILQVFIVGWLFYGNCVFVSSEIQRP